MRELLCLYVDEMFITAERMAFFGMYFGRKNEVHRRYDVTECICVNYEVKHTPSLFKGHPGSTASHE